MIRAVIYDKVPNTAVGMMGGEMRVVGHHYHLPGSPEPAKLETVVEEFRKDQKVVVLTYSNGFQQIIPDRGVEKILKFE